MVDFFAGFGDTISFGATSVVRGHYGVDAVDYNSGSYVFGEGTGVVYSMVGGGAGGLRLAGTAGKGIEFSHWIPNRWGGPRSLFNGNFVAREIHALSDPFRYGFMPRSWKLLHPMPSAFAQQWTRIPWVYKGAAGGLGYGMGSIEWGFGP